MPAQQRLGCDDPVFAQGAGERFGDCAEQGAVVIGEGRPANLSLEYLNPVSQHDDLEVLRASRTERKSGECSEEAVEDAMHDLSRWRYRAWPAPHARVSEPHRLDAEGELPPSGTLRG